MSRTRSGGRDTTAGGEPLPAENGYFFIADRDNGEFDYGLKQPGADPPVGQFALSDRLRQLYGWCADHVENEDAYQAFLERLRAAFFMGAVQEPINSRAANRLMDEIEGDLVVSANRLLRKAAERSAVWYLGISGAFALSYLVLDRFGNPANGVENYLLIAAAAVAALAVRTRARATLSSLANYQTQAELYEQPFLPAVLSAVLVVGATICIQNKLVTLTVLGQAIDVQNSISTALALGFIFGLLDVRLLPWMLQQAERVLVRPGRKAGRS